MFFKNDERHLTFEKASYWALLTLAAVLPLAVYGINEVPILMTKIWAAGVLTLIGGIFFAAAKMKSQELSIHKSLILGAAWGLPAAYLLSTLFASDVSISFFGNELTMDSAAFLLIGALALTLTSLVLTDAKRALGLYLAMLGSAAVLTVCELLIFFAREAVTATHIVLPSLSLLGTLNDLAVFFGLITLFTLLSLMLLPVSSMVRYVLWGVLVASSFFLAVVNLTVLWWILGGFVLALLVYALYARFMEGSAKNEIMVAPLAVVIVCAFFLFGSQSITSSFASWAQVGELDVRPSWSTTVRLGSQALAGHRLFGVGPDTFVEQWSKFMPADIAQTPFWRADFTYGIGFVPTSVIATGIVGLIAWLLFFGLFAWNGARSFYATRKVARGDVVQFLRVTSFVGALYLWIIAVIQVPSPALVIYAFMLTGVYIAARSWGDDATKQLRIVFKENPRAGFLVTLTLTFLVLLAVGGVYSVSMRHAAESAYQSALRAVNGSSGPLDPVAVEAQLQTAIDRHPVDKFYRLLSNVDLFQAQQKLQEGKAPEAIRDEFQQLLARAVANAQQATIVDAKDHNNWENFGSMYQSIVPLGIEGAVDSALASYDQALERRPSSPHIYLSKAALERQRGNATSARENVEKAIALRNQYTDAIFLLAQMQLEANDTANALKSVEGVTVFEPGNPVAWFQLGLLRYGSNDFTGAIQALERAVALNDQYANARYFLGLAYWRLGNDSRAADVLEQIMTTNPDNKEVPSMVENLRAGRDPYTSATAQATSTQATNITKLDKLPLPNADAGDNAAIKEKTGGDITP